MPNASQIRDLRIKRLITVAMNLRDKGADDLSLPLRLRALAKRA